MRARSVLALPVALLALAAGPAGPNDPYFHQQWGLMRIGAADAWGVSRGEGIVVAVVDSGVFEHPDLEGAFARRDDGRILGLDLVDDDDDPTDEHGHGTMVAGLVAARTSNGIGIASTAPLARLMPIRVLDGEAGGTSDDVEEGIRWAVDHGAHVVNLSLEVAREPDADDRRRAPDAAVRYAWSRGVVVVAAAGNEGSDFTDFPDDSPVLLVGATDRDDRPAAFSDAGRLDAVVAPGVDVISTWCDPCGAGGQPAIGQSEGTSYAAAHVAGTVALLRAAGLDAAAAVERVRATAVDLETPGPDPDTGRGRLDTAAALRDLPAPPATPPGNPTPPPTRRAAGPTPSPAGTPSPGAVATTSPAPAASPPGSGARDSAGAVTTLATVLVPSSATALLLMVRGLRR